MRNNVCVSTVGDGYMNLAVDQYILQLHRSGALGGVTLYFYVNSNAVIIGRNQNAWRECDLAKMERDGVQLVRRHSGGGAVYHDEGNLNFSFITDEKHYDLDRQLGVIIDACSKFGITARVNGRNDLTVDGRKFSGNAFALSGAARGHHGTILIDADIGKLSEYLTVSELKLRAKGVTSVKSRVCNLASFTNVTVSAMRRAIINSFAVEYGSANELMFSADQLKEISKERERMASWEWRFGKAPHFDYTLETRLSFGEIQLMLGLRNGIVYEAKAYTDSLNTETAFETERLVIGSRFEAGELGSRLLEGGAEAAELGEYIQKEGLR